MEYQPSTFDQFIGQTRIKRELNAMLANKDNSNIIFRGNYGSGKTTIAKIYSDIRGKYTYSELPQVFPCVINKEANSHIIDEIHLEDRFERFFEDMKKYTLIFCTTETENIPAPFLSRCVELVMEDYNEVDLQQILFGYAFAEKIYIEQDGVKAIASRSKFTPRIATQLLKRLHNMSVYENQFLTGKYVEKTLDSLRVLDNGLIEDDVKYLMLLYYSQNPLSLNTLAAGVNRSLEHLKTNLEPYLLYKWFISITPRGRIITEEGKEVIRNLIEKGIINVS